MIAFINLQIFWLYPQVASDPMGMATKIDQLCDSWPTPAKPSVVFVPAPLHPSTAQGLSKSASMGASHVPKADAGGWMWRSLVIVRLLWQVHNKIQQSRMNAAKHVCCLRGFFLFAGHFPVYFQRPKAGPSTNHEPSFNIMPPGGTKRPYMTTAPMIATIAINYTGSDKQLEVVRGWFLFPRMCLCWNIYIYIYMCVQRYLCKYANTFLNFSQDA